MAGIFQRLFKTGQAEAHALVDKLEDPIKISEQAVRDLKKDLADSLKSLAEVKALAIRMDKNPKMPNGSPATTSARRCCCCRGRSPAIWKWPTQSVSPRRP